MQPRNLIIIVFLFCPGLCLGQAGHLSNRVVVSKQQMRLAVLSQQGDTLAVYRIACGTNYGDKQSEWDSRTPEGRFTVESIEDPALWPQDPAKKEGPGEIYGPRFFRLKTPGFTGIGIHGTSKPELIPGRITLGCIRLSNRDITAFSRLVGVGTEIHILPDDAAKDRRAADIKPEQAVTAM